MLVMGVGSTGPGGFATPGQNGTHNDAAQGVGLHFKLTPPIAGLTVGASIQPNTGSAPDPTAAPPSAADVANGNVNNGGREFGDASYRFGLAYSMSGLFSAAANLNYSGALNDGDGRFNTAVGLNFVGLSDMGITGIGVDLRADNVTKLDTGGAVTIGPKLGFKFGDLTAGAGAYIYVPVRTGDDVLDVRAVASLSYPVLSNVTASLGANYNLKGALSKTNKNAFDYRNGDGLGGNGKGAEDTSTLGIQPSVSISLNGSSIGLGYGLLTQLGGDNITKHGIYMTFGVSF
jgi:hypothetical protein